MIEDTEDEDRIEAKERARWWRDWWPLSRPEERRFLFSGRRQLQLWGLIAILAILVWLAVRDGWETISIASLIAAWIVYSLHHSFTAVLHEMHSVLDELYELNYQISGRRENF